jgi:hypothetical protein
MRRIKTKQLSRFMTSLIKAQKDVLSKLSLLLKSHHNSDVSLNAKDTTASIRARRIEFSRVIIAGIMAFTDFCAETVSNVKIVSYFDKQHCAT